ncbi:NAD(P)-dependent oxidoreductase [Rubellimicrobium rubrum]|uniref:NAD(P)-dependent oxidoreductase n=1 Tax=Rubellimicrobium rubrum TaxID=2585369 RepID=A0A5C4N1J0_9RHOB|nr:NAD(P)-dependent oxidoreductase [Rubellimicrobium rubrum]TNC52457.1 NAD(P)-dependent oxidoreductase [Rubellimicrobium rubrum]
MLKKIVLTGAAGELGSTLREPLSRMCEALVCVDLKDAPGPLASNESWAVADCAELDQVAPLMEGAEIIVNFVGIPDERSFEELLRPNFLSSYVIWEAAYRAGVRRVVYASSVHAVGMWETNAGIDTDAPHRPDTFYGLSKCFAEDLARLYWEKRGLEAVCLRIFSATESPENPRALGTWLSRRDLVHLVERAVDSPTTGFCVVYGVSDNDRSPVSNARVAFLGYRPRDNAETHAAAILAKASRPDPSNLAQMRLGGPFATVALGESGVAGLAKLVKGG